MLKIKENIDLKKLEKYGFKMTPNCFEPAYKEFQNTLEADIQIRITNDRKVYPIDDEDIYNLSNKNAFRMYDTLYDLIKDGIVEKVKE